MTDDNTTLRTDSEGAERQDKIDQLRAELAGHEARLRELRYEKRKLEASIRVSEWAEFRLAAREATEGSNQFVPLTDPRRN